MEINAETYAICEADLLLKGEEEAADNFTGAVLGVISGLRS
jgi:type I restriction-modification system DNA methylase subunit